MFQLSILKNVAITYYSAIIEYSCRKGPYPHVPRMGGTCLLEGLTAASMLFVSLLGLGMLGSWRPSPPETPLLDKRGDGEVDRASDD